MSKRPIFFLFPGARARRMCELKAKYDSAVEALHACLDHRAYRCSICGYWHLTSSKWRRK